MDEIRYGLAVLFTCTFLSFLVYWPLVHGLIRFWRRLGPGWTQVGVWAVMLSTAAGLFCMRSHLVRGDGGTHRVLLVVGALCLLGAGLFLVVLRREMSFWTLIGMAELSAETLPGALVRTGVYARVRHPRYVQLLVAQLGWACVANYGTVYLLVLLWLPAVYMIVAMEERELRERFGEAYEAYSREVPRFVPRLGCGRGRAS